MLCPGLGPAGAVGGTVDGSDSLSSHVQHMEIRKALPGVLLDLLIANAIGCFSAIGTSSSQEALEVDTSNEPREEYLEQELDED